MFVMGVCLGGGGEMVFWMCVYIVCISTIYNVVYYLIVNL